MTADELTRARAVLAGLREAEGYGRSVTVTYRTEGGSVEFYPPPPLARWIEAVPALLALAEAVGRLIEARTHLNLYPGAVIDNEYAHDVLAAFADLATLAGDADAGEVGA